MAEQDSNPHSHRAHLLLGAGMAIASLVGGIAPTHEYIAPEVQAVGQNIDTVGSSQVSEIHTTKIILDNKYSRTSVDPSDSVVVVPNHISEDRSTTSTTSLPQRGAAPTEVPTTPFEATRLHLPMHEVPPEVSALMRADTILTYPAGCSGSLIRNEKGEAVGALTAEHCYLQATNQPRIHSSDGVTYIVKPEGYTAYTGENAEELTKLGEFDRFIVNPTGDLSHDSAIGVFAGQNADEVKALYESQLISEAQLANFKLGDTIYLSGWPLDQDNNIGPMRRQEFAGSYLGQGDVPFQGGKTIKMIWVAIPSSKDGAECSFGDSGGEGFVIINNQKISVGSLSAFRDLMGDTWGTPEDGRQRRLEFEKTYGVNLDGFTTICGFAYQMPTTEVRLVHSLSEVPKSGPTDNAASLKIQMPR